jgi:hypothetical protein
MGLDPSTINDANNVRTLDKHLVRQLPREALLMLLWFITAFAEEGGKRNSSLTSAQYTRLNESATKAMQDILFLIDFALSEYDVPGDPEATSECRTVAMLALRATKYFYINVCTSREDIIAEIKLCLTHAIAWANTTRAAETINELVELLANDRIFDDKHYEEIEKILTTWGKDQLREDLQNEIDGVGADNHILALLIAYTDSRLACLLEEAVGADNPSRPRAQSARLILGEHKAV